MIEKLPTHSVYDDPKTVSKINELVGEVNKIMSNQIEIVESLKRAGIISFEEPTQEGGTDD